MTSVVVGETMFPHWVSWHVPHHTHVVILTKEESHVLHNNPGIECHAEARSIPRYISKFSAEQNATCNVGYLLRRYDMYCCGETLFPHWVSWHITHQTHVVILTQEESHVFRRQDTQKTGTVSVPVYKIALTEGYSGLKGLAGIICAMVMHVVYHWSFLFC
jgi:hypothetical protein